jgi:glycosyltransferase involved in cell wall biosynthesis
VELCVDFEIIVMEDGSEKFVHENDSIAELLNSRHIILKENRGRSAVRNKLADEAKYDHLLFMDCDAEVASPDFISKYLTFCKEDCVVIGGTAYDPNETNPNYSLRLKYGRVREARSASERGKNNFATFNFLISKSIFDKVRFDESIRGYGHEDMLFGHQLHQLGYEFIQIENPLIHKGLDDNRTFLKKTEEGTRNLFLLYKTDRYPFLAQESTLLHTYLRFKRYRLTRLLALKFDFTKNILRWLLCCKNPSLPLYDLYKLLYLCKISHTK